MARIIIEASLILNTIHDAAKPVNETYDEDNQETDIGNSWFLRIMLVACVSIITNAECKETIPVISSDRFHVDLNMFKMAPTSGHNWFWFNINREVRQRQIWISDLWNVGGHCGLNRNWRHRNRPGCKTNKTRQDKPQHHISCLSCSFHTVCVVSFCLSCSSPLFVLWLSHCVNCSFLFVLKLSTVYLVALSLFVL